MSPAMLATGGLFALAGAAIALRGSPPNVLRLVCLLEGLFCLLLALVGQGRGMPTVAGLFWAGGLGFLFAGVRWWTRWTATAAGLTTVAAFVLLAVGGAADPDFVVPLGVPAVLTAVVAHLEPRPAPRIPRSP